MIVTIQFHLTMKLFESIYLVVTPVAISYHHGSFVFSSPRLDELVECRIRVKIGGVLPQRQGWCKMFPPYLFQILVLVQILRFVVVYNLFLNAGSSIK